MLLGQQAADADCYVMAAAVADHLQRPLVTQVAHLEVSDAGIKAKRQTEHGYDLAEAPLPAVVSVSDAINSPRLPSIKAIMGAKKKPLDKLGLADAGLDAARVGAEGARNVVRSVAPPVVQGRGRQDRRLGWRLCRQVGGHPGREGAPVKLLVHVHHDDGEFSDQSLGVLAKAATLGAEVTAFVAGSGIDDGWAAELGGHGAQRVLVADDAALAGGLSQPLVDALEPSAREADGVLFGAGVVSADVAAGLAARLGTGIACETTDIAVDGDSLVATRPALGDTVMVDSGFTGGPGVVLARANAFAPADSSGGSATVERVAVTVADWSQKARIVGREQAETGGVDITEAETLVAVGRGMGGPENVPLVEALAKAIGGEVAATRAVVDAGWVPYSMQVGQTGKTVSPKLYIACGVSGAIQHKVGMSNAGTIVAINKDANAPIHEFADVSVIGDALTIIPKLTEALNARS